MARMTDEEYDNEYFDWLVDKVRMRGKSRYNKLLRRLHETEFIYLIRMDKNRKANAIHYRRDYLGCVDTSKIPCSVLEVLVSFAAKIDREWNGYSMDERPEYNFWEMIENLGLDRFTDGRFNERKVDEIIFRWLTRDFEFDGTGSIFPILGTENDQRKKEMWTQMTEYLYEKSKKK